jgi:hypothetical protein
MKSACEIGRKNGNKQLSKKGEGIYTLTVLVILNLIMFALPQKGAVRLEQQPGGAVVRGNGNDATDGGVRKLNSKGRQRKQPKREKFGGKSTVVSPPTTHTDVRKPEDATITVVLMGYSPARLQNYKELFGEWAQSDPTVVEQIIFIWNNQEVDAPAIPTNSTVPFISIHAPVNSMVNRYNVTQYLSYNPSVAKGGVGAVLMFDDDMLMSKPLLACMLRQWKEAPAQMLGIDLRSAYFDPKTGQASYNNAVKPKKWQGKLVCSANLNIGKTMLFDAKYLGIYMNDHELVEKTKHSHCEDIAMNALINKASGLPGRYTQEDAEHSRWDPTANNKVKHDITMEGGLSEQNWEEWKSERRNCVSLAADHFGVDVWDIALKEERTHDELPPNGWGRHLWERCKTMRTNC